MDRLVSLGENESEVENFDSQILGGGGGEMIDDPMEVTSLDFCLEFRHSHVVLALICRINKHGRLSITVG